MLRVLLPKFDWFDEEKNEFCSHPEEWIRMEHSLLAISQWESKWKKPFLTLLDSGGLSSEELLDYFGLMIIDPPMSDYTHYLVRFSPENMETILKYLKDSQTATTIHDWEEIKPSTRSITSELVYTWMIGLGMSKDFETWNINRLFTLIRVASVELHPDDKLDKKKVAQMQRDINEINKKKLKTRG